MFYPLSTQLAAPSSAIKNEGLAQPLSAMRANLMPTLQQTIYGLAPVETTSSARALNSSQPQVRISHPRLAPSAVSAEEFITARAGLSPAYIQDMAATRAARTSNMHDEMPRFRDQVDLLA